MGDKTWKGTSGNNYDDFHNWSPTQVPTAGDRGIFGPTGMNKSIVLSAGPLSADAWIFKGGAYTITISGATIDLLAAGIQVNAGSARIDVQTGGDLAFQSASSAGSATLEAQSGGTISFNGTGSQGAARFIVDSGGVVDFASAGGPGGNGNIAGSIEGAGTVHMGDRPLTIGTNNRSAVFSGTIDATLIGVGLTKAGTGTFTLSGTFSSTGAVTIAGGTFDVDTGSPFTDFTFAAHPQETLRIENVALSGNTFSPLINNFRAGNTIDLAGLPFVPGATATYNTSLDTLSVNSGSTTITFDDVAVVGSNKQFVALGDDHGGTRVMLGILGTAGNNLIDGTHAPAGQHRPTSGPDVILGLAGNDTLKGLGGNDILVGGAGKDMLFGGPGLDSFVFQTTADSRPAHPDVIMDFSHAQHDRIDLYDLFHGPQGHALRFIGADTFAHFHHIHPTVLGMVRYAAGVVQVNVNANLAPDLAITMHGAPPLHAGDFIL